MTLHEFRPSRRAFLAGAGLVIGYLSCRRVLPRVTQGVPMEAETIRSRL